MPYFSKIFSIPLQRLLNLEIQLLFDILCDIHVTTEQYSNHFPGCKVGNFLHYRDIAKKVERKADVYERAEVNEDGTIKVEGEHCSSENIHYLTPALSLSPIRQSPH